MWWCSGRRRLWIGLRGGYEMITQRCVVLRLTVALSLVSAIAGAATTRPGRLLVGPRQNIANAHLAKARLAHMNLNEATLSGANLQRADLSYATLEWARLYKTNLRGATLIGACLWRANLFKADLREANLQSAKMDFADLRLANLQGAKLENADLRGTLLNGAKLFACDLSKANLAGATFDAYTRFPDKFDPREARMVYWFTGERVPRTPHGRRFSSRGY